MLRYGTDHAPELLLSALTATRYLAARPFLLLAARGICQESTGRYDRQSASASEERNRRETVPFKSRWPVSHKLN